MKRLLLIVFLFLSAKSMFCQTDSTQNIADSVSFWSCRGQTIQLYTERIIGKINLPVHLQYGQDSIPKPFTITSEVTSQLGGLSLIPFRFENKVNQMANMVAGVLSYDGSTPSILGARPEGTAYYIDGVRVMDGFLPPTF